MNHGGSSALIAALVLIQACTLTAETNPPSPDFDVAGSDSRAIEIADAVMERLGGRANWDATRYITWRFFGQRLHVWDKWTGDSRFEQGDLIVLANIHSHQGRAWQAGQLIEHADTLAVKLDVAFRAWINDSYWLVMPYKLKDSGVTLKYKGAGVTAAGEPAEILELTFAAVGVTPNNKYDVYVDAEEHLVRQWAFYANAEDPGPRFVSPWSNWKQYGKVWLADDHGSRKHTDVRVLEQVPAAVFDDPAPLSGEW
jgi:hypothetical protein